MVVVVRWADGGGEGGGGGGLVIHYVCVSIFQTDEAGLIKYVRLIENSDHGAGDQTLQAIILGILEGETRTMSSVMTIEVRY